MKKIIVPLIAVALAVSTMQPSKSNALVGLSGGEPSNANATTAGILTGLGGLTIAGASVASVTLVGGAVAILAIFAGPLVGMTLAAAGIVVLDDNGVRKLQYVPVSDEDGANMGLSDQEISSFNQDVETINALQDQILREADSIKDFDENKAGNLWVNGMNALDISNDSRTALVKITASALKVAAQK